MLSTFSSLTPYLKYNPTRVCIDNIIFKLHYRWTFIILLFATILVTSRQYIGEHIKCVTEKDLERVINTYCFFTPTFTLVRHLNNSAIERGIIFQPGIGPFETQDDPVKRHGYYQWVPFVLFGQALCFYIPHFLWKSWEGGRIKALVFGQRMIGLTKYLRHKSLQIGKLNIPSMTETELRVKDIRRTMIDRMRLNQSWGAHLVFAEFLNLFNLVVQIYFTNKFLGGQFYTLGYRVIQQDWQSQMDILDIIFPKVTKCHFYKYGVGGSLQVHDTLCVMALNIINEKIYSVLWFWYAFLLIATIFGLLLRALTLFLYKKVFFTKYILYWIKPGKLDESELSAVIAKCNFSNWLFLVFLRSNLAEFIFQKVIYHLASEFPTEAEHFLRRTEGTAPLLTPEDSSVKSLYYAKLPKGIDEVDMPILIKRTQI